MWCNKRLYNAPGLAIHCRQVHKEILRSVPNAIPGRDDIKLEIYGSKDIPPEAYEEREEKLRRKAELDLIKDNPYIQNIPPPPPEEEIVLPPPPPPPEEIPGPPLGQGQYWPNGFVHGGHNGHQNNGHPGNPSDHNQHDHHQPRNGWAGSEAIPGPPPPQTNNGFTLLNDTSSLDNQPINDKIYDPHEFVMREENMAKNVSSQEIFSKPAVLKVVSFEEKRLIKYQKNEYFVRKVWR